MVGIVGGVISLYNSSLMVGGKVIRSQHPQPSGSRGSEVYVLVDCMHLTPAGRGVSLCTTQRTWLRLLSRALGEELKVRHLCCGLTIIILSYLTVFLCLCIFSLLGLNSFL